MKAQELFATPDDVRKAFNRKTRAQSPTAKAAERFGDECKRYQLPPFARELRFAHKVSLPDYPQGRGWRFDYAWPQPEYKLAVEIEGFVVRKIGSEIVVQGRHATISGIYEDIEKYTNAMLLGWTVLRFGQKNVMNEYAINMTMRVLASRGWISPWS